MTVGASCRAAPDPPDVPSVGGDGYTRTGAPVEGWRGAAAGRGRSSSAGLLSTRSGRDRDIAVFLLVYLELREIVDDLLRLADRQVFRDRLMLRDKILIRLTGGFLIDELVNRRLCRRSRRRR
jgi:hypothetical protein